MTEPAPNWTHAASIGDLRIPDSPRLADHVYESLRRAIIEGRIPAGSKLSVPALARQLDVSRSPIREAVARLTADRLAIESPRRGAVVAGFTLGDLVELYEAREALEGTAARLAAERAGLQLREALTAVLREHQDALETWNDERRIAADAEFHRLLRDTCGNRTIAEWLEQLQARVQIAMLTTAVTAGVRNALEDHERIAAAVIAGDADGAEREARAHIARLRTALDHASTT
jgi:DNA-binding GntR family transcriptional regulator